MRQLLTTLTPSIIAANYRIAGLWIGSDLVSDLKHTAVSPFRYEGLQRVYLDLAA